MRIFPPSFLNAERSGLSVAMAPENSATDSFARLFLASGAQHCASAAGPAPADSLDAVVAWVEHGTAPAQLLGTTTDPATGVVTGSRPVCQYPQFPRYTGHGSTTQATSYICAP